ncbi:SIS domain-containing protein [Spirosoma sp. KCTC 42546]|uniref:D-sedoheptulose-7-phosphate isomerase n=1 Tax=Spirosoma sp. KCTC 42546 TaxID=2520506 RepID=UPI0011588E36|nr:SIS domain-containing protein [Spirosoma sp. KCTC 42546]QDK79626.1 SIS domain-containing protein [Spirosoma sp. KCTC 42546]
MNQTYFKNYLDQQKAAYEAIPIDQVEQLINLIKKCWEDDRQLFAFGNGGSASNVSHFITDLGKSASDIMGKRFRCTSLNESVSWITALGNDYAYEDIFLRQLQNYARPGDLVLTLSVSGNSPNVVKAVQWANDNGLTTIALVGAKRGQLADLAHESIVIQDEHYGRVEDAQMTICHMLCYGFIEEGRNG